jgi:hypothetical protein
LLLVLREMPATQDTEEGAPSGELCWLIARNHNADNGISSTIQPSQQ